MKNHWHLGTSRTCMALCRFQGQRDLSGGPRLAWGSGCPGLCARPFSSTSGPRKTDRRKQQHPSPSPCSSSICTAELDGPARMWRAPPLQLFLVFICCVRWCHSEGKWFLHFLSFHTGCQLNDSLRTCRVVVLLVIHSVHLLLIKTNLSREIVAE